MTKIDYVNEWMSTDRIETLVDGIFAIAMTILVLSIGIPNIPSHISEAAFQQQILTLWPKIWIFILSFYILSAFWRVNHQQFKLIKKSNTTLISINILFLLFIVLVPFSTDLLGEYGHYYTSNIIFQFNLFCAGAMYNINWYYAAHKKLVDENVDQETISYLYKTNLTLPIVSIIAMGLSFYIFAWSSLIYMLAPVLRVLIKKI